MEGKNIQEGLGLEGGREHSGGWRGGSKRLRTIHAVNTRLAEVLGDIGKANFWGCEGL